MHRERVQINSSCFGRLTVVPFFFMDGHSLEERLREKDALLTLERQESEATKKSLSESEDRNQNLLMKIEVAEKEIAHFQETIQRSVTV